MPNRAALAVILLAGGLSAAWAFIVPIFQAPDEPAHFDYAMSIYGAHRLIRLSDGSPAWIVSPYTKYLLRASDFNRIAWHSSMRAPAGYGSPAYFARVDAGAPNLHEQRLPNGRINYIVPFYPFGFYAIEALWLHVIALFTSSIVAIFFAARLLCIFLLMLGLYFNYRTAINLGVPRWTAVMLVAAIGFFPMTSFVSSYVQPDNLAYTLLSATLFLATELRRTGLSRGVLVALGLSLGLLAVTKYQFFLSAALPVIALVVSCILTTKPKAKETAYASVALLAPAFALLAAQRWLVDQRSPGPHATTQTLLSFEQFRATLATGIVATVHYTVTALAQAFTDCFLTGACGATYWQIVGWFDTPIVIFNPLAEGLIRIAVAGLSLITAVAIVFLVARNARRLYAVARRGARLPAFAVVTADPVLNSYLCFVAIMLALYVLSFNAFGVEGRHWYPYIFASFLCFVWYAPRWVRKEHRAMSAVLAGLLLSYSLVAAVYALAEVETRYYGPTKDKYTVVRLRPEQLAAPHGFGVLRQVEPADYHVNSSQQVFSFSPGTPLAISGAFLSNRQGDPSASVVVDGKIPVPVLTGQYQFLIAEASHSLAMGYSGFFATISTLGLSEGAHTVEAYAGLADGYHYRRIPPIRLFFLTTPSGRFSESFMRQLQTSEAVPGSLQSAGACRADLPLFRVRMNRSDTSRHFAIWLVADDRPYPARYDRKSDSFVATIPSGDLPPGAHALAAYAIVDPPHRYVRIAQSATFQSAPADSSARFVVDPPAVCSDALGRLAGTSL